MVEDIKTMGDPWYINAVFTLAAVFLMPYLAWMFVRDWSKREGSGKQTIIIIIMTIAWMVYIWPLLAIALMVTVGSMMILITIAISTAIYNLSPFSS